VLTEISVSRLLTCFIITVFSAQHVSDVNLLAPNDDCSGHTAPLTSKCCILYIYSTNIGTEYFKHGIYCPFFPLQNAACFINLMYLVPLLFTFYIQGVLKLKKNNSVAKRIIHPSSGTCDLFVELFHGLYCSGSMCVGVTLWFGWGG